MGARSNEIIDVKVAQVRRSDEVVKGVKDVLNATKMGDGMNDLKMEEFKNSTKNRHLSEVH